MSGRSADGPVFSKPESGEERQEAAVDELAALRARIDDLDRRIVDLLNERATVSVEVGRLKISDDSPVFRPDREAEVLRHIRESSSGPLPAESLESIYGEILAASRALQRKLRVGYLGPAGTFTHEAARRRFGLAAEYVPANTVAAVFELTQKGDVDLGVVPVENSTEGAVNHTLDLFLDYDLKTMAEISLPISHNLLSRGVLSDVKRVYSHPQAIAQSRRWLSEHLPEAELVEVSSTSLAAKMAVEPGTAAIATETAARVYGLSVIATCIEDASVNVTRFLVIGSTISSPTGRDMTSIVFSIKDRVGALHDALEAFQSRRINLTRIESRPSKRKPWDYVFYIDVKGHPQDQIVSDALAELEGSSVFVKVLGAWPIERTDS